MIVFDLACNNGHRFEGWFGSSADFSSQRERGLLVCPQCESTNVGKAPMAPSVPVKGNVQAAQPEPSVPTKQRRGPVANGVLPPEVTKAMTMLAEAQAKALKDSKWVGNDFAEKSRAIHYGEQDAESIHGEASAEDAQDLIDEGITIAPLPFPVSPPDDLN